MGSGASSLSYVPVVREVGENVFRSERILLRTCVQQRGDASRIFLDSFERDRSRNLADFEILEAIKDAGTPLCPANAVSFSFIFLDNFLDQTVVFFLVP